MKEVRLIGRIKEKQYPNNQDALESIYKREVLRSVLAELDKNYKRYMEKL